MAFNNLVASFDRGCQWELAILCGLGCSGAKQLYLVAEAFRLPELMLSRTFCMLGQAVAA